VEQLTRYVHHTKAPKPDSEDDDEEENINNLFMRTATSASLQSTNESTISASSNSNPLLADTEADKENKPNVDYQQEFKLLGNGINAHTQRLNAGQPLTSIKNRQNIAQQSRPQLRGKTFN